MVLRDRVYIDEKDENTLYVMDSLFFIVSLLLVGVTALFGVLLFPFLVIFVVYYVLFRKQKGSVIN